MSLFISILKRRFLVTMPILVLALAITALVVQLTTPRSSSTAGQHTITITTPTTPDTAAQNATQKQQVLGDTLTGSASGGSGDAAADSDSATNTTTPTATDQTTAPSNVTSCTCTSNAPTTQTACANTQCQPDPGISDPVCGGCGGRRMIGSGRVACMMRCL